jgi:phospholipid/cholesterol/gamma-HCH transport system ATP-binding protein
VFLYGIRQRLGRGELEDTMAIESRSGSAAGDAHVAFADVYMAFGDRPVFRGLSCAFPPGKISVVLGGSGSGKSTALRLIGGLVRPRSGHIYVTGDDITALSEVKLYAVRKKLGMMFQGGALLDSLTIFDNLAFPLREHTTLDEPAIAREVARRLEAVGLPDAGSLLPNELSGGMLKRAALARAIMLDPVILLCDEPFSGLDPISVKRIEALLVRLNRQRGITIILVSHHIASTMRMADRVIILFPDGPVVGTPAELRASSDERVTAFLSEEAHPEDTGERRADTAAGGR